MNPNEYQLNEYDKTRIQPLLSQISKYGIRFKYFITIAYWYAMKDYGKCCADAQSTRAKLRSFFKSGLRAWFFIEKHTKPGEKNYGGFHLHCLVEEPINAWAEPSARILNWVDGAPKRDKPSPHSEAGLGKQQKLYLIKKVVQRLQKKQLPQGERGVDVREISDLERCLSYCSKQYEWFMPSYEVLAPASDIDFKPLLYFKQNGLRYETRPQAILARANRALHLSTSA
jgi:hypothetical protein